MNNCIILKNVYKIIFLTFINSLKKVFFFKIILYRLKKLNYYIVENIVLSILKI